MRVKNWAVTCLGAPDTWPDALQTLAAVMLGSFQPVFVIWGPQRVLLYNDACAATLALKQDKGLGIASAEGAPSQVKAFAPWIDQAYAGEPVQIQNLSVSERTGATEELKLSGSIIPIRGEAGEVVGVFCTFRETAGDEKAPATVISERTRLERLFQRAPGMIVILRGPDHIFDFVNAAYLNFVGEREVIGKTVSEAVPELTSQGFLDVLDHVYATGEPFVGRHMPVVLERPGEAPETCYFDFVYQPITRDDGRVTGIFGEGHDVTMEKRTELALRESEARKTAILDAALDCIIAVADDSKVVEWNRAAEATFGYARETALGQPLAELIIPPNLRQKHYDGLARYLATGQGPMLGRRIEVEALRSDGSSFPAELAISTTNHIGGRPLFTGSLRDITERKRAEMAVRSSEAELAAIFGQATAGMAECDVEGCFRRVNDAFCNIVGRRREDLLLGTRMQDITHPDDLETSVRFFHEALAFGDPFEIEKRYVRPDGSLVWVNNSVTSLRDETGRPRAMLAVSVDITERKAAEEALRELTVTLKDRVEERTRELEEVNEELKAFAYTVSHDLRAPLRAMEGFARIVLGEEGAKLDAKSSNYLQRIIDAAVRMDRLIQDLLAYSRLSRGDLSLELVDLGSVLDEAANELLDRIPAANIEIRSPVPTVWANRAILAQIISNLLSNAAKFVARERLPRVRVWAETKDGLVRVCVEDNGIGIAPEHHSKVFEVFQRLHSEKAYPGSGIGLAIVRKGAERMGGRAGLVSEPGKGSCFWIEIRTSCGLNPAGPTGNAQPSKLE